MGDRLDHHPRQLSGGQQQRVAIARSLVNNPKILLADEPTGALDSKTSEEIMLLFTKLNEEGITVILVTHEPDIAEYAKRRITFRDGKIIDDVRQEYRASGKSQQQEADHELMGQSRRRLDGFAIESVALDPDDTRHHHRCCICYRARCCGFRRAQRS